MDGDCQKPQEVDRYNWLFWSAIILGLSLSAAISAIIQIVGLGLLPFGQETSVQLEKLGGVAGVLRAISASVGFFVGGLVVSIAGWRSGYSCATMWGFAALGFSAIIILSLLLSTAL